MGGGVAVRVRSRARQGGFVYLLSTGTTHRSMAAAREGSARPSGAQRRYASEASQQLAWFGLRRGLGEGLGLGLGLRLGLALNQPQS